MTIKICDKHKSKHVFIETVDQNINYLRDDFYKHISSMNNTIVKK